MSRWFPALISSVQVLHSLLLETLVAYWFPLVFFFVLDGSFLVSTSYPTPPVGVP